MLTYERSLTRQTFHAAVYINLAIRHAYARFAGYRKESSYAAFYVNPRVTASRACGFR